MANPFKEAEKAKKKPAGNPKVTVEKEEVVPTPDVEEKKDAPVVVPEVKAEPAEKKEGVKEAKETPKAKVEKPAAPKKSNLLAGLNPEKEKEEFGTQAFYLSKKNIEKLKKVAEKEGVSVSKLMNYIISEVL